jgi:hypothetical protein
MTGYAAIAAIVFLYVSDFLYRAVVARAKSLFPPNLQEERKASFSLGAILWLPFFPADLRRKYLWSIGFAVMGGFCVVIVSYNTGHRNWAAFFACLVSYAVWHGVTAWSKYRARL